MISTTPCDPGSRDLNIKSAWNCITASFLMLLTPFVVFVSYQGYPFFSPEILWIIFGIFLSGIGCGLIIKNLGSLGQVVALTCMLGFSIGLIGDFQGKENLFCVLGALVFSWLFLEKILKVITFTFSIFIVTMLIFPS